MPSSKQLPFDDDDFGWGIFKFVDENEQPEEVHVVPCNSNGDVMPPHQLVADCRCQPKVTTPEDDPDLEATMIEHNMIH